MATGAPLDILEPVDTSVHKKLQRQAVRGTFYIVLSYGLSLLMRVASSLVLTRIFSPEYFGIMTLLTTVLIGLNLFSHIGLGDSVIQNARGDDPVFLNTVWTLQVFRGFGLWVMTLILAFPVAHFYHEPRMIPLLPALGFGCIFAGASSPSLLTLARHMGVGKISFLELFGQAVLLVVTVGWAWFHASLWALVAGRLASEIVRMVASYFIVPELRPRFALDRESVREILHFGKWILVGTALTFLASQSDRLILGKLVTTATLGIYGIAYTLSDLPRMIVGIFSTRIGFPFMARFAQHPRDEYRAIFLKYRMPVLAAGGLGLILVICTGDQLILHFYDSRYHQAAWMLVILALGLWHTTLYSTTTPAVLALSKAHYNAFGNLVFCIALFTLIPVGYHYFGMLGAVCAVAIGDLPVYFVVLYSAYREQVGTFLQDALMTLGFGLALTAALTLRHAMGFGLPIHIIR